jgi:hypothetical protein
MSRRAKRADSGTWGRLIGSQEVGMKWLASRAEQHARLMGDMMDRLGVDADAAAAEGHALAIAARRCMFCPSTTECEDWLASVECAESAPAFCPNRALLARCGIAAKID